MEEVPRDCCHFGRCRKKNAPTALAMVSNTRKAHLTHSADSSSSSSPRPSRVMCGSSSAEASAARGVGVAGRGVVGRRVERSPLLVGVEGEETGRGVEMEPEAAAEGLITRETWEAGLITRSRNSGKLRNGSNGPALVRLARMLLASPSRPSLSDRRMALACALDRVGHAQVVLVNQIPQLRGGRDRLRRGCPRACCGRSGPRRTPGKWPAGGPGRDSWPGGWPSRPAP